MSPSISRLLLVKNAIYNVLRGSSSALVAIVLPPLLTRILSKDTFNVWILVLQLSTYVSFFDFGTQTAVGKYIAHTNELKDFKQRDSIISTSIGLLSLAGLFVSGLVILLALNVPSLFKEMPKALHQDAQNCILIVGLSLAVGLPFSTFFGVFVGLQKYGIAGIISSVSKIAGAIGVFSMASLKGNLVLMGASMAIANLAAYALQFLAIQRILPKIKISYKLITKTVLRNLINYCSGLLIWNLGMLLVSGLDTIIVGFLDYNSVAYYALAVTITNLIIQLHSALFGVLLPAAATLSAREDEKGLGELLTSSTRYSSIILLIISLPFVMGAKQILELWVGSSYAENSSLILQLLVVANIIRLSCLPYSMLVLATGQQHKILLSPLLEGIVNFTVSIIAAKYLGVIGVAIGTVVGSFISVGVHFCYSMPRTLNIKVKRKALLFRSILNPLLFIVPHFLVFILNSIFHEFFYNAFFVASLISFWIFWKICLVEEDRVSLKRLLSKSLQNS